MKPPEDDEQQDVARKDRKPKDPDETVLDLHTDFLRLIRERQDPKEDE